MITAGAVLAPRLGSRKDAIKERKAAPMRMCNVTLVEITEALARKCPSAEAALGICLAIMAGGANAGLDGKDVPRVAFLGFEFINTSLEATAPVEVERIRLLDDVLRQKLTASSRFVIVDIPPDTIKEIASGPTISNCNGCQCASVFCPSDTWASRVAFERCLLMGPIAGDGHDEAFACSGCRDPRR